jgi:hypothetical protein
MTESRPDENETNPVPQEISDSEETNPAGEAANDKRQKCCAWARFQGVAKAQGYGFVRTTIYAAKIFVFRSNSHPGVLAYSSS